MDETDTAPLTDSGRLAGRIALEDLVEAVHLGLTRAQNRAATEGLVAQNDLDNRLGLHGGPITIGLVYLPETSSRLPTQ